MTDASYMHVMAVTVPLVADFNFPICLLSEVKVPYNPVCQLVGRSFCHNILRANNFTILSEHLFNQQPLSCSKHVPGSTVDVVGEDKADHAHGNLHAHQHNHLHKR